MKEKQFVFKTLKIVYSSWKYWVITIVVAFLFYAGNVLINHYDTLPSFYSTLGLLGTIKLSIIFMAGFINTVQLHSYVSLILISGLFGLLFSLIYYKTKMIKSNSSNVGIFSSVGIFLGVMAPGCAACGIGLLSAFGLSAAFLSFLPYEGLELSILSIGILSFSVYKITKSINKGNVCEINLMKGGNKK